MDSGLSAFGCARSACNGFGLLPEKRLLAERRELSAESLSSRLDASSSHGYIDATSS